MTNERAIRLPPEFTIPRQLVKESEINEYVGIVVIVISVIALISLLVIVLSKVTKKKNQGPTMNLEVVRQSAPVVETNAEDDQQLMAFLLGGNSNGVNNQQKKCPVCGAVNNSHSVNCANCGSSLGNINQY